MKKTLIAIVLTTASVWAAPEGNVYHTIADPTWHVTKIGSRWVIEDSKGFFVGYYVPQATAPVANTPAAPPSAPAAPPAPAPGNAASQGNSGGSYYSNGAYGNYNGYGYNGYGSNGFYGNNGYYNNGSYHYNPNCQPVMHQNPQPQRDPGDVPGTPWKAGAR